MILFVVVALLTAVAVNAVTILALLRIHPRRRRFTIALAIAGNVMWLFFPLLNARTDFSRFVRATLGPPWFAWLAFAIVYATFIGILSVLWLAFARLPRRRGRVQPLVAAGSGEMLTEDGASRRVNPTPLSTFARWPSRVFLGATIIGSVIGYYDAVVPLRIERVPISIAGLPREAEGMRIAVMADLHVGLFTRVSRLQQFFATSGALQPDLVVIAGDLIDDDPWFIPRLLRGANALSSATPLIAVLGNHEMYGQPWEAIGKLRGSRVHLLVNEGLMMRGIWVAGLSDYAARDERLRPNLDAALAKMPAGMMPIVIAHQPKAFDAARIRHIPLTIVAHTHGGQCGIRPLHWSLAGLFLPYHMGLYNVGGSQLYVNTGTGYWLVPFRLGMTPEITLIELHAKAVNARRPADRARMLSNYEAATRARCGRGSCA